MDTQQKTGTTTTGLDVGILPYYRLEVMTVGMTTGFGIHATAPPVAKTDDPKLTIRYDYFEDGRIYGLNCKVNGNLLDAWFPSHPGDTLEVEFPKNADVRLVPFVGPATAFNAGEPVPPPDLPAHHEYGASFPSRLDPQVTIDLHSDYGGERTT